MENIIYYFTGTGNSLYVANKLAELIGNCDVKPVTDYDKIQISAERIGLVFPTYYWGLPNIVKKFISEMKIMETSYFFIGYTFGGYSGVTPHMAKKMLQERGLILNAAFGFQLPQNFAVQSTLRIPNEKTQEKEFSKADERFPIVAKIIKNKDSYFEKKPLRFRPFHGFGFKLNTKETAKIPMKAQNFTISEQCTGCGLCVKGCLVKNIKVVNNRPVFENHCEFCWQCLHICPKEAIDYEHDGKKTKGQKRYKNPKMK